jgi:phage/plasmid-like protein (TIGR03299 family)
MASAIRFPPNFSVVCLFTLGVFTMSHELEQVGVLDFQGFTEGTAQSWHNLGVSLPAGIASAVDAGLHFGMFWPIGQYALEAVCPDGTRIPIDTHVANVREKDLQGNDIRHLLGIVGADYSVCQNRELAEFTDALAQSGQVQIETIGSIRGGKRVWFLARGESFKIGGTDEIVPYVLVSNGHDGTQAIRVTPTTVRVVCSNTLHMVIPNAEDWKMRPETAAITIRHCGSITDKLEQAKKALEYYGSILKRNQELFELMNEKKMAKEQALDVFAGMYANYWEVATADELASKHGKVKRLAENRAKRMDDARDLFMQRFADEQTKLGTGSTSWAWFNALTGYLQHDVKARGENDVDRVSRRMESNLFGLNVNRTHDALASVLAAS